MSRIGKKIITIPAGVDIKIDGGNVTVKGPKGTMTFAAPFEIDFAKENDQLTVILKHETKQSRKMWGTARALVANMITGVTQGFEKKLEVEGVGYRVTLAGKNLELLLGFSHPVKVPAPEGIEFKVEKNAITISGISKDLVGRTASSIRALKKPEPYKGKGIRYAGEIIRRKAGKKASAAG